ncbi:MAG: hypothetical protein N2053_01055, partial [Chitinispirillaceae bacterium]|nr:hypothetical protein [Chitinispirillaceae bacterium]
MSSRSAILKFKVLPDIPLKRFVNNEVPLKGRIAVFTTSVKLPSDPVVAVCPPFSSFTTAPARGVIPVSVTMPLIFAIQSKTPTNPASNVLIKSIKTSSFIEFFKKNRFHYNCCLLYTSP